MTRLPKKITRSMGAGPIPAPCRARPYSICWHGRCLPRRMCALSLIVAFALIACGGKPAASSPDGGGPWAHMYAGDMQIDGLSSDAEGNVYAAGYFVGRAAFDEQHVLDSIANAQGPTKDIFIAKHRGKDGTLEWVKHFGGSGAEGNVYDVTVIDDGTIVASGAFSGEVDFDGTRLTSTVSAGTGSGSSGTYGNMFLVGLGPDGLVRWARQATGAILSGGNEVAPIDGDGIVQAGNYGGRSEPGGTLGLGTTELSFGGGTYDTYVARLDGQGVVVWARPVTGAGAQRGKAIAADAEGNVLVAGDARYGPTDFGLGDSFTSSDQDFWVAKYSPTGTLLWWRQFSSSGIDEVKGVAADAAGNVVVAASFEGPGIDLDPNTHLVAAPGAKNTGLVFALSPDGQRVRWTNTITSVSKCCEMELTNDRIFVSLAALGPSVTYGDGVVFPVGGRPRAALLTEFDRSGARTRSWTIEAASAEFGELTLRQGATVVAGSFTGPTAGFGDLRMTATSQRTQFDLAIVR